MYGQFNRAGGIPWSLAKGNPMNGGTAYKAYIDSLNPDAYFRQESGAIGVNSAGVPGALDGTPTDVSSVTGKDGGAGSYNSTTSLIEVPTYTEIENGSYSGNSMGVMAWVYLNSSAGTYPIIVSKGPSAGSGSGSGWMFYERLGGLGFYSLGGAASEFFYCESGFVKDTWLHVAMTVDVANAGTAKMWINGVSQTIVQNSLKAGANISDNGHNMKIGSAHNNTTMGTVLWDGVLDEVAVWTQDRLLLESEVQAAYAAATESAYYTLVTADTPKRWYQMNELSGSTAVDSGSDATDYTQVNSHTKGAINVAGRGFQFNASAYYHDVPDSDVVYTDDFTIECIFNKAAAPAATEWITGQYNGNAAYGGFLLGIDSSGRVNFAGKGIGTATYRSSISNASVCDGTDHLITVRISSNALDIFVDGAEVTYFQQQSVTGATYTDLAYFAVGCYMDNTATPQSPTSALIDEFQFYASALSDANILARAQSLGLA